MDSRAFQEREISFGEDSWTLPGTLSIPYKEGPFPALVLVHGSGPNDRDETLGANKPFRDLAQGLASRGIAVLRFDKRTRVHGARIASSSGLTVAEEAVDDAVLAVGFLQGYPTLNHLFMTGAGPSQPDEYQRAGHVSAEVISDVAAWILSSKTIF